MIEKQAQIVVKQKEVSEESKKRKEALLAQYANVTDEEEYPWFIDWKNSKSAVSLAIIHIFHHAKEMRETVSSSAVITLKMSVLSLTKALKLKKRSQQLEISLEMIKVSFVQIFYNCM